ncbi:USP6 N-terminal-like protein isoform X2 [Anopheles maculipalpis]|uniref:USP6 N-terminal-like protein isoform X2 n=1 Tax=Anopheles maculipalpis TaxID=1496333 RepID=UPI002158F6F3|nr:USP6 N-terminal-like protein isoform X2 [Anopheles maculipalpis]
MTRYDRYSLSSDQQQQQQQHQQKPKEHCPESGDVVLYSSTAAMTDEELLLLERANAERDEIFLRYDQGRKCDSIDAWEDPLFEVYTQADRYGFLHPVAPKQSKEAELLHHKIEMERLKKWVKMDKNWDSAATKKNLPRRIMKGIPDRMRSAIWRKLLDLDRQIKENVGMYDRMLQCARHHSPDIRQIDFDVNRQFRNHLFYRERYSVKQQSLFRVLAAYSMYNTEIGYCQGMSTVAAVLLMYFDEEDTFWALDVLMTNARYAMHGLYIVGFPKLMRFLAHHDRILTKCMPSLKKHLDKHEVHSVLYSLKWFFVIFIERIPFSLCLRVWDIYMMFGERVLTAMAYTILKIHKSRLLRMKDMDQVTDFLQTSLHKQFGYHDDHVIKVLQHSMDELKKLKLLNLPPASANELPTVPRGQTVVEPSAQAKIGHRNEQFSEREIALKETVLYRSESKNEDEEEQYNGDGELVVRERAIAARAEDEEEDERTEKDYDDITEDTVSQLHTGVSTSSLRTIQSFTTFDTGTSMATSLNSLVIIDSIDDYCDNDRIIEESTRL